MWDHMGQFGAIAENAGSNSTIQDHTSPLGLYRAIGIHMGPYKTIKEYTGTNKSIQDQTGPYKNIWNHVRPFWTIQDPTHHTGHLGPHRTIWNHLEPYTTIQDYLRPKRIIQGHTGSGSFGNV